MAPHVKRHIQTAFLTLVIGLLGLVQTAQALTVNNVRLGVHPDKTRLVLDLDEEAPYRTFVLSDPWRLVIDLPRFEWNVGSIDKPPGSVVSDLRKGAFNNDISRIVIDLRKPSKIKTAFFLPATGNKPDRLVVDFTTTSVAEAMSRKSKLFGPLKNAAQVSAPKSAPVTKAKKTRPEKTEIETPAKRQAHQDTAVETQTYPPRKPDAISRYEKPTIVIDAGHGGADPGAISPDGTQEKHLTLSMARELKKQLERTGRYHVKMTRNSDRYLRLHERVNFARDHDGDLFISLHADSIRKNHVRGASVYTLSEKASDAQTAKLAIRENRADLIAGIDLSAEEEVVVNILVDLAMRDTMNQSKFMANTLVESFEGANIRMLNNPHRYAGFAVLKAPDIPSILVEMGFLSNNHEVKLLKTATFQRKLGSALVDSINAYFSKVRQNSRT